MGSCPKGVSEFNCKIDESALLAVLIELYEDPVWYKLDKKSSASDNCGDKALLPLSLQKKVHFCIATWYCDLVPSLQEDNIISIVAGDNP